MSRKEKLWNPGTSQKIDHYCFRHIKYWPKSIVNSLFLLGPVNLGRTCDEIVCSFGSSCEQDGNRAGCVCNIVCSSTDHANSQVSVTLTTNHFFQILKLFLDSLFVYFMYRMFVPVMGSHIVQNVTFDWNPALVKNLFGWFINMLVLFHMVCLLSLVLFKYRVCH